MTRIIVSIILLIISALSVILYLVGNHGHLMFRPHMTEDWIIWGIALSTFLTAFYLLTTYLLTRKTRKINQTALNTKNLRLKGNTPPNKRYSKYGVCVFVETFEIFTYICAGRQLSNNLIPHLPQRQPLALIIKNQTQTE